VTNPVPTFDKSNHERSCGGKCAAPYALVPPRNRTWRHRCGGSWQVFNATRLPVVALSISVEAWSGLTIDLPDLSETMEESHASPNPQHHSRLPCRWCLRTTRIRRTDW
jgi:hypothetical protein